MHIHKSFDGLIEKTGDARFVMSAATPDRVKDTIDPDAYAPWIGKRIIALWQHDSEKPFGSWENLQVKSGKLIGDLKIAGTHLGQMIQELLAADVPLGASIGFRGKGDPNKIGGIHFKELELLECSVVSVPAHPAAYRISKQFNISFPASSPAGSGAGDAAEIQKRAAAALQSSLESLHLSTGALK